MSGAFTNGSITLWSNWAKTRRIQAVVGGFVAAILTISSAFLLAYPARAQEPPPPPPFAPETIPAPAQPPNARAGATLFAENCTRCHGVAGDSDGEVVSQLPAPPPKLSDPATVWQKSPAEFFHIIKVGNLPKLMPPWGQSLSDEEIWQVAMFAWSLHTTQAQVESAGAIYAQSCAECHGTGGAGDGASSVPGMVDLSSPTTMNFLSPASLDNNWRTIHPEVGADWSEDQRRQMLDFVRSLSYIPPWASPYRAGEGVISGAIRQGTQDGAVVGAQVVTLTAYLQIEPVAVFSTTTDANSNFTFTQLSTDTSLRYLADTSYQDIGYNSALGALTPLTPSLTLDLAVYETSSDAVNIQLPRANVIIDFRPGELLVGEIFVFNNSSDRTFIGQPVEGLEQPGTLALSVPPGAQGVQFQDGVLGGRYQQVGQRIYDVVPMAPGERVLFMSYSLPVSETTALLEPEFLYPVTAVNLLVAELPALQVDVPALQDAGAETLEGRRYLLWSTTVLTLPLRIGLAGIIPPGGIDVRTQASDPAAASAGGEPPETEAPLDTKLALGFGLLLAVVLAGVLLLPLRQSQIAAPATSLAAERDSLLKRIAQLDDLHAIGQLDDAQWSRQRAQLKSRLLDVARELKDNKN